MRNRIEINKVKQQMSCVNYVQISWHFCNVSLYTHSINLKTNKYKSMLAFIILFCNLMYTY